MAKMFTIDEVARRAKQAMKEGVTLTFSTDGTITVKNSKKGTVYGIDANGFCSCPAYGHCKHQALAIYTREIGNGRKQMFAQTELA